jgi:hypothetical protein
MTVINYEMYIALLSAGAPADKATAAAAAVLRRPFTVADATIVRDALIDAGSPPDKAEAAMQSLLEALQ